MSLEHVIDLTLHLGSFRNFEMMYTGAYRINVRAYTESKKTGEKKHAVPYNFMAGHEGNTLHSNFFELYEAEICSPDNSFMSGSFYVDYSDVLKELNQICIFRFTLEGNVPCDFFIEMDLLMLQHHHEANDGGERSFNKVSSSKLKVKRAKYGMHEFVPAMFADFHFSYVECFIHTSYISFKVDQVTDATRPDFILKYSEGNETKRVKLTGIQCLEDLVEFCLFKEAKAFKHFFWKRHVFNYAKQIMETILFIDDLINSSEQYWKSVDAQDFLIKLEDLKTQMKNECEGIPDYLLELPDTSKLQLSFQIVYEQNKTLQRLEQLENSENVNPDAKIFIKNALIIDFQHFLMLGESDQAKTIDLICLHMNSLQRILRFYYFKLVDVSLLCYGNYVPEATKRYHLGVKYNLSQNLFQNHQLVSRFAEPKDIKLAEFHTKLAEKRRVEILQKSKYADDLIPVENCVLFDKDVPILFEDVFQLKAVSAEHHDDERDTIYRTIDMIEHNSGAKDESSIKRGKNGKSGPEDSDSVMWSVQESPIVRSRGNTQEKEALCDVTDFYYEVPADPDSLSRIMSTPDAASHVGKYEQQDYLDMADLQPDCCDFSTESESFPTQVPIQPLILARFSEIPGNAPKVQKHLVVLVSGYMGSSFDMTFLKNNLMFLNGENTMFVCSSINDGKSCEDIDKLGLGLAQEVQEIISMEFGKIKNVSFIAHSLGGLIVRAALPRLVSFKDKMQTLVTFATPHLGCVNGQSALVNSGLKFLSKISSHKALHQMSLSDASEIKNCYLMSLSKYEGLDWFQNVIFFSSHQDYYVPFESARVEYGSWAKDQKGKGKYLRQMADNILGRLSTERLIRVDMNFTLEKSFDTAFIGRRAHVMVLDSFKLQAIFAYFYSVYFQ